MAQVQGQVKQFPKFGIVYPDGVSGIKVVRTFTQGPSKFVNADGSVAYTTPPPTIHELFGGGFAYADGSPVSDRKHLELLPSQMREKALIWFDGSRELSQVATENVSPLDLEGKIRPEPVYVLSTDLPTEKVTEDLDKQIAEFAKAPPIIDADRIFNELSLIAQSVLSISDTVKEQGKQIVELKKHPKAPRRMVLSEAKHSKQSEKMKARWADPDYKAKMLSKGVLAKWKDKGVGENKRRDKETVGNGKDTSETS